jgi:high-affinity iron transporter
MVLALLISLKNKFYLSGRALFMGVVLGVFLMLILWRYIDTISQMHDGTGLEWLYVFMHIIVYWLILGLIKTSAKIKIIPNQNKSSLYAAVLMALIIILQGTNFLIYFIGYWSQEDVANALFIGIVLGAGICISISILLYFLCFFLNERFYSRSTEFVFILFASGLFNKISDLLLQIDFLPITRMMVDLNFVVEEKSELGHFLKALFGYDASPTLLQIGIYFIALLTALYWCQLLKKPWRQLRFKEVIS